MLKQNTGGLKSFLCKHIIERQPSLSHMIWDCMLVVLKDQQQRHAYKWIEGEETRLHRETIDHHAGKLFPKSRVNSLKKMEEKKNRWGSNSIAG
jgi:hypothetical protein